MSETQGKLPFQERLESAAFCYGAEVVTGRGYSPAGVKDKAAELSMALAADPRIAWISVTDNPGGGPMLPPDFLAGKLADTGCPLVVHLTCKDANRSTLEAAAWRYAAEGCRNILALTGDYPTAAFGGMPQPAFDLDSVSLISMLSKMNAGFEVPGRGGKTNVLPQTDFYTGSAVSPFKSLERELLPQYFKLLMKIEAGADWVLPQLGYDMQKFHEVKLLLDACGLTTPVIGNVYLLTKGVARMFNSGKLPGCVVSDELFAKATKYAAGEDKGREFFRDLAAKQLAVFKGLGFAAGYLGGIGRPDTFFDIIERAESYSDDDWRDFIGDVCFSMPDEFFLFEHDEKTRLATPESIKSDVLDALLQRRKSREVSLAYRLSRIVHSLMFTKDKGLYGLMRGMFNRFEKKEQKGLIARASHVVEHTSKQVMYGCKDCGDCSLPEITYLCPNASCSKNQRNGPCGGSRDGRCELEDKECIWARAYARLGAYGQAETLLDRDVVVQDPGLEETSAWANFYLERDHTTKMEPKSEPSLWQKAKK